MKNTKNKTSRKNDQFYRNIRKKIYIFSYFMQNNNKISRYIFSMLTALDMFVTFILPMESVFDFQRET